MAKKPAAEAANQARRLIAGALADFLNHLIKQREPMLVGGQYKPDNLLRAYVEWSKLRGFDSGSPDGEAWGQLCIGGFMQGMPEAPETPLTGLQGPGRKKPPFDPPSKPEPPKRPPIDLGAGNDVDMDSYDDTPKGHRRQKWEDEGEDWKKGKPEDPDE